MRFRLETLLLSMLMLATSMATFGAIGGTILAVIGLGLTALIYHPATRGRAIEWAVVILMLCTLCLCMLPMTSSARPAARRAQCTNNLKQLTLALHNYHDVYKSFPPAVVTDAAGKPMHSWRVLILPYMEQLTLYQQYNFNQPWDGPSNRRWAGNMPSAYRCPSDVNAARMTTNYVAVVGPGTAWAGQGSRTFADFKDGTSHTILLVEAAGSGIHWMEPRDVPLEQVLAGIRDPRKKGKGIATPHSDRQSITVEWSGCIQVALADGSVRAFSRDVSPKTLRAMLTIDGGEEIDWDSGELRSHERPVRYWWAPGAAMVGSYVLLIWRLWAWKRRNAPPGENASGPTSSTADDGPRTTDQEPPTENR